MRIYYTVYNIYASLYINIILRLLSEILQPLDCYLDLEEPKAKTFSETEIYPPKPVIHIEVTLGEWCVVTHPLIVLVLGSNVWTDLYVLARGKLRAVRWPPLWSDVCGEDPPWMMANLTSSWHWVITASTLLGDTEGARHRPATFDPPLLRGGCHNNIINISNTL